jgi:acyl-CoA synthetase (AMP-forming)/AMP-acid ligase II
MSGRRKQRYQAAADSDRRKNPVPESKPGKLTPIGLFICHQQNVKAFVQLAPGESAEEQEIIDFCKEKLAGYKRPRNVEFRETLPTSLIGKVLRRVLRDEELEKIAE